MYIESVRFKNDYRCFKKEDVVQFQSDVTLLVGDQGAGKSTLLGLMRNSDHKTLSIQLSGDTNGVKIFFFDSENDNPRVKDPQLFTTPGGQDVGIGFAGALSSKFNSHGEVLQRFVIGGLSKASDAVVFLDEPESALSIPNQYNLIREIKAAVKRNCQLVIATHCYPLIAAFESVFDVGALTYVSSESFLGSNDSV